MTRPRSCRWFLVRKIIWCGSTIKQLPVLNHYGNPNPVTVLSCTMSLNYLLTTEISFDNAWFLSHFVITHPQWGGSDFSEVNRLLHRLGCEWASYTYRVIPSTHQKSKSLHQAVTSTTEFYLTALIQSCVPHCFYIECALFCKYKSNFGDPNYEVIWEKKWFQTINNDSLYFHQCQ